MDFASLKKAVDIEEENPIDEPEIGTPPQIDDVSPPPAVGAGSLFSGVRFGSGDDEMGDASRSARSGSRADPNAALETVECFLKSNAVRKKDSRFVVFNARSGRRHFRFLSSWVVPLRAGETVLAKGRWNDQSTFWAESYEILKPQGTLGLRKWLAGGAVAGVSSATADRLCDRYGEDVEKYLGDAVALEAAGIPAAKAQAIADGYLANSREHKVSMTLLGMNLGYSQVAEIMDTYGLEAVEVLKTHPWNLAKIDGVSFQTADDVAIASGRSRDDPDRILAGMEFALKLAIERDGHSGVTVEDFVKRTMRVLAIDPGLVRDAVPRFLESPEVVVENNVVSRVVDRQIEKTVAYDVGRISRSAEVYEETRVREAVRQAEENVGITLDETQREAAIVSLMHPFSVVTGGPGVGKSTTLKVIVEALEHLEEKPKLSAPTGRASKRMTEVSGLEASTIHRLLKFSAQTRSGFVYHRRNPLPAGRYIVDETSMMDIRLSRSFLQAIPEGSRVILVGDVDQLPSVGPGQILRDLIESGTVPVSRLTKIHRQGADSGIIRAAYRVNSGGHIDASQNGNGFNFIAAEESGMVVDKVVKLVADTLRERGFDPRTDVQVLAPMRTRGVGVDLLNAAIKKRVNEGSKGDGRSIEHAGRILSEGDRVIHNKNRHKIGVYNGDVGYVVSAEQEDRTAKVVVEYADQKVEYTHNQLYDIELCYATTIHKSQGSEYPAVVVLVSSDHAFSLNRNLIYTAITRGRDQTVVVGSEQTLREAIDKVNEAKRTTSLTKDLVREFAAPSFLSQIEATPDDEDLDEDVEPEDTPALDRDQPERVLEQPEHRHPTAFDLMDSPMFG